MNFSQNKVSQALLLGGLLGLALIILMGPALGPQDDRHILISDAEIAHLAANWERTWQRKPTEQEMQGLIQSYTREEVLYREAISKGMDRNNLAIRRALVTQMENLAGSQGADKEFSEEDLRSFYALRKEQYLAPGNISFAQVYLSPDRHGEQTEAIAQQTLVQLQSQDFDPQSLGEQGDPIMIEPLQRSQSPQRVHATFGGDFATQIFDCKPGHWTGPIPSGYGLHLVYVLEKESPKAPDLASIQDKLLQDMRYEEKQASQEQFYQEISQQYEIVYKGLAKEIISK